MYLQAVHTVKIIALHENSMTIRSNYLVEVSVTDFVTVVGLNRIKLWLPTKTYKEMGYGLTPAGN